MKVALALLIGFALGGVALAGCGDDTEETPPQNEPDGGKKPSPGNNEDGGVPDGGNDGPGKASSGAGGRSGGKAGSGAGGRSSGGEAGETAANAGASGEGPITCDAEDCPGAQCEPFDNAERIAHPDYAEGEDLPTNFP